jgi:hypothetical protein
MILLEREKIQSSKIRLFKDETKKSFFVEYWHKRKWVKVFRTDVKLYKPFCTYLATQIDFQKNEKQEFCGDVDLAIYVNDEQLAVRKVQYSQWQNGLIFEFLP